MAKVLVYDEINKKIETFFLNESDAMPYNEGGSLVVGEFRGSSKSTVLWTTKAAMQAWNITREEYGEPIYLGYAFKRIWEGGHSAQSQHYAGVAFDCGQIFTAAERKELYDTAVDSGVWGYVEPLSLTPTWVHFDRRTGSPACSTRAGYPTQKRGSRGVYTLILQDALNTLGFSAGGLDGIFGANTESALKNWQRCQGLSSDGICGCQSWQTISTEIVGTGQTSTTVDP